MNNIQVKGEQLFKQTIQKKNFQIVYYFRIVYINFCKAFEITLTNKNEDFYVIKESIFQMENIKSESDFFNILRRSFLKQSPDAHYISILSVLALVFKGISLDDIVNICNCDKEHIQNIFDEEIIDLLYLKYTIQKCINSILTIQQVIVSLIYYNNGTLLEQHKKIKGINILIYKNKKIFQIKGGLNKYQITNLNYVTYGNRMVMIWLWNIENFQALSKPTNEGLFYIMLQICRFSNFENDHTPPYKHPELRGQSIEIAKKKTKLMNKDYSPQQQGNIESLNMVIKANRDYFINYYISQFDQNLVQEYMNKFQIKQQQIQEINKIIITKDGYGFNFLVTNSQKAIKLALIAKQTKQMIIVIALLFTYFSFQTSLYQFKHQIEIVLSFIYNKKYKYFKTRAEHNKTERSIKKISLPSLQKIQFYKKLDQIIQLKNRLKDYSTIRQNMYLDEVNSETQKTLEITNWLQDELKKQQENLSIVQLEMKQMNIHFKNLDKLIAEQITIITELSEKVIYIKQKSKIETKKAYQEKKQLQHQLEASRRLTYFQNIPPSPGMILNIENSYFLDTNKKHQNLQQINAIHSHNEIYNRGNKIKIKFFRLKSEKVEENILKGVNYNLHTQDLLNQLTDLESGSNSVIKF
ncbi:unnamed protein product [Paramecium sonneborni]|uniref:Uncharacterized protein n=1 Tax=Paramecium sonneborni TaxID=65129 RepID=A0A8S1RSA4_9CILI|nr:unnamed protein product [Paramecium sonneborni]